MKESLGQKCKLAIFARYLSKGYIFDMMLDHVIFPKNESINYLFAVS